MKKTIYEILTNEKVPNIVEIIDVHGGTYFVIALNGKIMYFNNDFTLSYLDKKFINKCKQYFKSEDILFVHIKWYDFAQSNSNFYDANDFLSYEDFINFLVKPFHLEEYQIQKYSKNFDDSYSF